MSELLHADKTNRHKFIERREDFESKGLKANHANTKVLDGGSITADGLSKSENDPCGVPGLRVEVDSVLCAHSMVSGPAVNGLV